MKSLHAQVGSGDIHDRLVELCRTAAKFYAELLPITAAALGSPQLREGLAALDAGPHRATAGAATYLAREQATGRIARSADPTASAALLLGACQQRAVMAAFASPDPADDDIFATRLVDTLWAGLAP